MVDPNTDLVGDVLDAPQLAVELRVARAKLDELRRTHRRYVDAFGRIAAAAGVLDSGTLEELTDRVVERLRPSVPVAEIAAPSAPEAKASSLICDACGNPGATDLGEDTVLCRACSGEEMRAEARAQGVLPGAPLERAARGIEAA